jgi:hypothetical protein
MVGKILHKKLKNIKKIKNDTPSDQPDKNFIGPF